MNKTKEEVLDELKICLKGNCEECDYESDCNKNIAGEELIFKNVVELLERYEKMSNRPTITEDDLELAHTKGMEEAWDIIKRIDKPRAPEEICDIYKHFGTSTLHQLLEEFTPHEAKAKIEAWEEQRTFRVGDVVKKGAHMPVIVRLSDQYVDLVYENGATTCRPIIWLNDAQKTGKHIDLDGLFKQIGE